LLIFSGRYLYLWSFHAEEHVSMNRKKRKELRKKTIYLPQYMFFGFYDQNPIFEIWINRIVGALFVISSLIMLFASIFGPLKLS